MKLTFEIKQVTRYVYTNGIINSKTSIPSKLGEVIIIKFFLIFPYSYKTHKIEFESMDCDKKYNTIKKITYNNRNGR